MTAWIRRALCRLSCRRVYCRLRRNCWEHRREPLAAAERAYVRAFCAAAREHDERMRR